MAQVASDIERELNTLEAEMKRLEAEYNMFFAGRSPRPPSETRGRVDAMVKTIDRRHIGNTGARFRFSTLQSRHVTLIELWDRGLRAREEGRPGPFAQPRSVVAEQPKPAPDRILNVQTFKDPLHEMDKLRELYDSLAEARREVGEDAIAFHKFAELIETQVGKFQQNGTAAVAFRVAVKHGKVAFTARGMKEPGNEEG